ncbi:MAG: DUF3786 domain-containing protein [Desulfobacterota bacterium]|nr:DUF3786 domain-containing protein [Thermodesulfobacteriota bacterium]
MQTRPKNALEIYKLLDKSNCRKCGEKTCLAFAGAVFQERRKLQECPQLPEHLAAQLEGKIETRPAYEPGLKYLAQLKSEVAKIDLAGAAERTGGSFADGKLTLKVLGKDFAVDGQGNLSADIHINPWVAVPLLNYLLHGAGLPVTGRWVSLRELTDGRERYPLFQRQCEEPLQRVADVYTSLFDDIVQLFSGRQVAREFDSDISVVLNPLPKVPILLCYWLPEEGMDSNLLVFFDETADRNLDTDSVFTLGVGLAHMIKKIALRHGFAT